MEQSVVITSAPTENDSGAPSISPKVFYQRPMRHGESFPYIARIPIINSADTLVFTDAQGNPLAGSSTCTLSKEPDLPPCDVVVERNLDPTRTRIESFNLSGAINPLAPVGNYTFYLKAKNSHGWSNLCTVSLSVMV